MTPDRGPDGRSLGHSHVEHVQPPNRGYAGYYLPNIYQENYRIRTAEELDALPSYSVIVGLTAEADCWVYQRVPAFDWSPALEQSDRRTTRWATIAETEGVQSMWTSEELLRDVVAPDEHLFVVYRPDMLPPRRDPA